MSDEADAAQRREAEFIADHLAKQTRRARLDAAGADTCADCNEPIPLARRVAMPSAHRCVGCQAFIERIGRIPNKAHA